jgi:hypothetical protein
MEGACRLSARLELLPFLPQRGRMRVGSGQFSDGDGREVAQWIMHYLSCNRYRLRVVAKCWHTLVKSGRWYDRNTFQLCLNGGELL